VGSFAAMHMCLQSNETASCPTTIFLFFVAVIEEINTYIFK